MMPRCWCGLVAAILVSVAACDRKSGPAAGGASRPPPVVEVQAVEVRAIERSVRAVGSIEAIERVLVSAEVEGVLRTVAFEEGDGVAFAPGEDPPVLFAIDDTLLRLDVDNAQARLQRAEADVAEKRAAFERKRTLYEQGATTEAAYTEARLANDRAEAARAEAEAALRLSEERLRRATVRAPMPGILGERRVSPGDFLKVGTGVVELVATDPIEVSFTVPERYRAGIRTGLRAVARVEAYPGERFEGEVVYVSPSVEAATRTVRVKARVPNADGRLQPGLFAGVELVLGSEEAACVVPEEAIVPREGAFFVYLVNDGVAHRTAVRLGQRGAGWVEVVEGLSGGETVIVSGHQRVSDGVPVRVKE